MSVSRNFTAARMSWSLSRWVGLSRDVLHSVVWIKSREKAHQHPEGPAQAPGEMNSPKVSGSVPPGPVVFSRRCYHCDSSDISEPWTPGPRETRVRSLHALLGLGKSLTTRLPEPQTAGDRAARPRQLLWILPVDCRLQSHSKAPSAAVIPAPPQSRGGWFT